MRCSKGTSIGRSHGKTCSTEHQHLSSMLRWTRNTFQRPQVLPVAALWMSRVKCSLSQCMLLDHFVSLLQFFMLVGMTIYHITAPTVVVETMSLSSLPTEIQLEIISYINDFCALRSLHLTNRHFSSLVRRDQVQAALFEFEHSHKDWLMQVNYFPCYSCLQISPRTEHWFRYLVIASSTADICGEDALSRRCRACDAQEGNRFSKSLSVKLPILYCSTFVLTSLQERDVSWIRTTLGCLQD